MTIRSSSPRLDIIGRVRHPRGEILSRLLPVGEFYRLRKRPATAFAGGMYGEAAFTPPVAAGGRLLDIISLTPTNFHRGCLPCRCWRK